MRVDGAIFLCLAFSAICPAVATSETVPAATRFKVGDYAANLLPSKENICPTVTFGGRTFAFADRTGGWLLDKNGRRLRYHSGQTNAFAVLKKTAKGVRADYVHALYVGDGDERRFVGVCSNEVVFADGVAGVRAALWPTEPGRYRFHTTTKASQCIFFAGYAKNWVGTTLQLLAPGGDSFMNELTPHDRFDPDAWGLSLRDTGYASEMVFGNRNGVIRFKDISGARFIANRYRGGFEAAAVCLNDDAMHKPAWDKPVVFSYAVRMER